LRWAASPSSGVGPLILDAGIHGGFPEPVLLPALPDIRSRNKTRLAGAALHSIDSLPGRCPVLRSTCRTIYKRCDLRIIIPILDIEAAFFAAGFVGPQSPVAIDAFAPPVRSQGDYNPSNRAKERAQDKPGDGSIAAFPEKKTARSANQACQQEIQALTHVTGPFRAGRQQAVGLGDETIRIRRALF
jgi:hypothetical protein